MSQNVNCHNKVCLSSGRPLIETHQDSISVYLSETILPSRYLFCCLTPQPYLSVFKYIHKVRRKVQIVRRNPQNWIKTKKSRLPAPFPLSHNEMCSIKINQISPGIRIFLILLEEISYKVGDGCCPIFFWPQQKK